MNEISDVLRMQDTYSMPATDLAVTSVRLLGPMTARELYSQADGFEDIEHCSRVLASLATREPVRLVRRMVDNPNKGQGNRNQVFQYDTPERGFQGTASGPDLFVCEQSPVHEPAAGPACGVPNNTGSREGGASFPVPDPTVGVSEASGAFERASDAGHVAAEAFEALKADLDAVIGQRDALLSWLGVDDFLDAEARISALRAKAHDAINDVAGYKMIVTSMRERLEVATDDEVPEAFDMALHDVYQSLRETDHPLFEVFGDVVRQVTRGKGARHGGEATPFFEQPWVSIANTAGNGFLVGQAIKKAMEAGGKPDFAAWETELLGAAAYLGMAVLHGRWRQREALAGRGGVAA